MAQSSVFHHWFDLGLVKQIIRLLNKNIVDVVETATDPVQVAKYVLATVFRYPLLLKLISPCTFSVFTFSRYMNHIAAEQ